MPVSMPMLAGLLAALAAIGPFAIDTYLPAFPAMGEALGASRIEVQQTLTAYMATYAIMVLWHGALADRFGRRSVIIISMLGFAAASMLCAFATSIEWLWLGRALQGMCGGAGMVVGRAVIRDLLDGAQAQRLMSRVMMIFAVAPAIAPMIGGALLHLAGWRSIFVFLALFSAGLAWATWRMLPETLPEQARQSLHPVSLGRGYLQVLSSVAFLLLAGTLALNFNAFFIYVLAAPTFLIEHLGLGSGEFHWLFVPVVLGVIGGSMLSGKAAGRLSPGRTIALGFGIMVVASAANLAHAAILPPNLFGSILPIAVFVLGMSLAMPSLSLMVLDLFPQRRGLASSCQSFVQVGLNALSAGLIVPMLWATPMTLAAGMGVFLSLGLAGFVLWGLLVRVRAR